MHDELTPIENFFAATLEETLEEWPATLTELLSRPEFLCPTSRE